MGKKKVEEIVVPSEDEGEEEEDEEVVSEQEQEDVEEEEEGEEEEEDVETQLKKEIKNIVDNNDEFTMRFVKEKLSKKFGKSVVKGNKAFIKGLVRKMINQD